MHVCLSVRPSVCMYVYIAKYTYTYIHTIIIQRSMLGIVAGM